MATLDWEYNFTHKSRGVAIIINNETFQNQKDKKRKGSRQDEIALVKAFKQLGFKDIRIYRDLTASGMYSILNKVSRENHIDADCFACAIFSHGGELEGPPGVESSGESIVPVHGMVYGSDMRPIHIKLLLEVFRDDKCTTLNGKPKVFLIQACRGYQFDEGVEVEEVEDLDYDVCDAPTDIVEIPDDGFSKKPMIQRDIPAYNNFITVYGTPPERRKAPGLFKVCAG